MSDAERRRPSTRQLEAIYSRFAGMYGAWTWLLETRSLDAAVELAGIRDGEAILEVAVGSGHVFGHLLRKNPSGRNVGVDLTDAMLAKTREKAERTNVPFVLERADARSLRFEDASFDVVLSNNMLGLLPRADVVPVVREMTRVLRPGGRLVLVTMACPRRVFPRWLYEMTAMRLGGWADVELEPTVRACGFDDVTRRVVTQLGFPSEILFARKRVVASTAQGDQRECASPRPGS